MQLFDSHAHYNDEQFKEDREKIIQETLVNGVSHFVVAGYNISSSQEAITIANQYQTVYAIVGISPNDLEGIANLADVEQSIQAIQELLTQEMLSNEKKKSSIVAIGEIGLDYYWQKENKKWQQNMFIQQIALANQFQLPIVIHTRDAVQDTLEILKKYPVHQRGIFHCCPLNRELVKEALKLGYYISLSGVITFKNAINAEEIIQMVPEDRLLIETDSPYLAPEPVRGTRNNCMNVKYVAEKIAKVKEKTVEEIAKITNQNAKRIFHIE